MAILSFGAMCSYIMGVSYLRWRNNIWFELNFGSFEITFERKKKAHFRQGYKATVAFCNALVCPLKLYVNFKSMMVILLWIILSFVILMDVS